VGPEKCTQKRQRKQKREAKAGSKSGKPVSRSLCRGRSGHADYDTSLKWILAAESARHTSTGRRVQRTERSEVKSPDVSVIVHFVWITVCRKQQQLATIVFAQTGIQDSITNEGQRTLVRTARHCFYPPRRTSLRAISRARLCALSRRLIRAAW
jgi:hypothetical protein